MASPTPARTGETIKSISKHLKRLVRQPTNQRTSQASIEFSNPQLHATCTLEGEREHTHVFVSICSKHC